MDKLAKLRQKLSALQAKGRELTAVATDEDRDLTDEELQEAERLKVEITDTKSAISREERRIETVRSFEGEVVEGTVLAAEPRNAEEHARGGFANLADFAITVRSASVGGAQMDERLANLYRPGAAPSNFHQESGGSSGEGFLVPPAMRDGIWELAFAEQDLLALTNPEPTARNQVDGLADETTPWGAAGIQANWRSEGTQMTASKLAQDPRSVRLHELYAYVLATGEMLEDAPLLNSRLENGAARAINWKASDSIMWGDGAGKFLGFMVSNALVTVAKESGQAAATLVVMNVAKMLSRLLMTAASRPLWLANSQIIPQLVGMTIGNQPMFVPAGNISETMRGTLFGYPIVFTEHCAALGDLGDIALVDMEGYEAYRRSSGPDFATSIHLFFDYNIEAFRWIFRLGGQPYLSEPVGGAKSGADSKSHFVTLAARA